MRKFRVGISSDFLDHHGVPLFPSVNMRPILEHPQIESRFLPSGSNIPGGYELLASDIDDLDATILWTEKFTSRSGTVGNRLALLRRIGAGFEKIDVGACTQYGVPLAIARDGVKRPVAVMLLTLILATTGKLLIKDKLARGAAATWGDRVYHMGVGLIGKTIGLLGAGNTGLELVRLCRPLDVEFIAHDPYADVSKLTSQGVKAVGIDDLFQRSDVLVVTCPLTNETHHIVNERTLSLMSPTSFVVNGARGPIVDQKALVRALKEGRIAGAGLDVLEKEPPDDDDPILSLPNVILNPHALCWTDQCFADCFNEATEGVLDVMHGRVPKGVINTEVIEHPAWKKKLQQFRMEFGL